MKTMQVKRPKVDNTDGPDQRSQKRRAGNSWEWSAIPFTPTQFTFDSNNFGLLMIVLLQKIQKNVIISCNFFIKVLWTWQDWKANAMIF